MVKSLILSRFARREPWGSEKLGEQTKAGPKGSQPLPKVRNEGKATYSRFSILELSLEKWQPDPQLSKTL